MLSDKTIRVQFECPHSRLPVITSLLAGEVSNFTCRDLAEIQAARANRNAPANAPATAMAPSPEVTLTRLARSALRGLAARGHKVGDQLGYSVVEDILEGDGFARSSVNPVLTMLVRAGYVSRIGRGQFRILISPVLA